MLDLTKLEAIAAEHDFEERALEGCLASMKACAREDVEVFPESKHTGEDMLHGYPLSMMKPSFQSHSLTFANSSVPYPYFCTTVDLWAARDVDGSPLSNPTFIATYRLIFDLEGEVIDDYFVTNQHLPSLLDE